MQSKSILSLAIFAAATFAASAAHAAVVTYTLSINDNGTGTTTPGSYAVYADDSTGNNFGIASYQFDITGATTITNFSPKGLYDDGTGGGGTDNIGFTQFRSGNNVNPVRASQDTVDSSGVVLVYGFGQTSGNLDNDAPAGSTGGFSKVQPVYAAHLLLAKGTYTGAIAFTPGSLNDAANVFTTNTAANTQASTISLQTHTLGAATPEPASLGLLAIGGLGLFNRRKKA